jgi:predicted O-methyltransferase YrrM
VNKDGANPALSITGVMQRADDFFAQYRAAIADVPPEAGFGGIWESEMLLFCAAIQPYAPKQILESGRGRGKSTLTLARCFPNARIVSVELDPASPNAPAAETKLRSYSNVELLYGDSRHILPQHLQTGDAVLIDGPKDFRAVRLALELLRTGKPCAVFLHDFSPDSPARQFIAKEWPGAFFIDESSLERYRNLDDERDPLLQTRTRRYGSFACLTAGLPAPFWKLRLKLFFFRITSGGDSRKNDS